MQYTGFLSWEKSKERGEMEKKYGKLRFVRADNFEKAISKGYKKIKPEVTMVEVGGGGPSLILVGKSLPPTNAK